MPDSGTIFPPAFRVVTEGIAAVAGGSLEFYASGTTTPLTVYSNDALSTSLGSIVYLDSGGHPVSAQGGSTKVSIFTGASLYKVVVKSSAGVTLSTHDGQRAAQDTSSFTTSGGSGVQGVKSKTADYSVVAGDDGYWLDCNPTGGAFTITLMSAVTATDGYTIGIRHSGTTTSNVVKIVTTSSQTISLDGTTTTATALTGGGEAMWLVSDGSDWRVISHVPPRVLWQSPIPVADRLTAPPTSPTAGAWYIINGTPTGAWASYAQHDVVRADGQGSWIRFTPPTDCGWMAYVQDEDLLTQFRNSAWTDLSNVAAPTSSTLPYGVWQDRRSDGTAGGTATGGWNEHTLQTEVYNTITGASLASNKIALPAGTYLVTACMSMYLTNSSGIRLRLETAGTIFRGPNHAAQTASSPSIGLTAAYVVVVPTGGDNLILDYYAQSNTSSSDLGNALAATGGSEYEVYATVTAVSISAQQGPRGAQGPQGPTAFLDYTFDSGTTDADPGTGELRFDNATLASVTNLYISKTGRNAESLGTYIGTWDDTGTASDKTTLLVKNANSSSAFMLLTVNNTMTDGSTYWKVPVTVRASGGTFTAADVLSVLAIPTGATTGALSGSLGATANIIPRTSGTGGSTLQSSGISTGTSGNDISHTGRTIQPWVSLTVANGTNNDVATPEGTALRITAPTAIFGIHGLTNGVDGRVLEIYNTVAFAMTIANESASSTAANRITTLTGADVSTTTQGVVRLRYDGTASRWILLSVQS